MTKRQINKIKNKGLLKRIKIGNEIWNNYANHKNMPRDLNQNDYGKAKTKIVFHILTLIQRVIRTNKSLYLTSIQGLAHIGNCSDTYARRIVQELISIGVISLENNVIYDKENGEIETYLGVNFQGKKVLKPKTNGTLRKIINPFART